MLFQTPAYTPSVEVDNREYDRLHADRFTADGRTMEVKEPLHMQHYHVNMAAMLQLAAWFDSLRENGVYDNTRIIIAADHGRNLKQFRQRKQRQKLLLKMSRLTQRIPEWLTQQQLLLLLLPPRLRSGLPAA